MATAPSTTISHSSKSILAKLMATENITVQHDPAASTASFDVKNRILTLPVWANISEDLYDMLVVHEVGHALDTPAEGWVEWIAATCKKIYNNPTKRHLAALKGFLNVIEDVRVDKLQKRRYPGSRRNYVAGYKELIERDFFGIKNKEIASLSFIDRVNVYYKGGISLHIKFDADEKKFLEAIGNTETFEEVLELTEAVFRYSKAKAEDQAITMGDFYDVEDDENEFFSDEFEEGDFEDGEDMDEEGKGKGKGKSKDADEDGDEGEGEDEGDEDGEGEGSEVDAPSKGGAEGDEGQEGDEDSDNKDEDGDSNSNVSNPNGAGSGEAVEEGKGMIPESQTEKAWETNMGRIVTNPNARYIYVSLPKPNIDLIVDDYKVVMAEHRTAMSYYDSQWRKTMTNALTRFKNDENQTISFMIKEFEMKKSADLYSRISIAKTGQLDTNKIHSYKYNEDLFRKLSVIPQGKNHGFVMFVDWSGSMSGNMSQTMRQLITLSLFCKRAQIPFEVYGFRDLNRTEESRVTKPYWEIQNNQYDFSNLKLRNILSSRMSLNEFNEALVHMFAIESAMRYTDPLNGTPLNEAIVASEHVINQFRVRNKLQIVNTIFLTDGGANGSHVHSKEADESGKPVKYILQDEKTKKTFQYEGNNYYNPNFTNDLLSIIKARTNCNMIGFFLTEGSFTYMASSYYGYDADANFLKKMQDSWDNDKFIPVTSKGYDEYYVINSTVFRTNKNELSVNSEMTKNAIAKNFMKYSAKKMVNRVLLRRFIEKISSDIRIGA